MIETYIDKLVRYGYSKGFFQCEDTRYVRNRICEILQHNMYEAPTEDNAELSKDEILDRILTWAANKGVIPQNTTLYRDLLDSAIMGAMLGRPSEVIGKFSEKYVEGPEKATSYLYNLSIDSNYIRKSRTDRNIKWKTMSAYGDMDITINVSKPEKDIKEIEAERNSPKSNYPKCLLCPENEGYMGSVNHPARQNLRIIPMKLAGEKWFLQYSPYLYYDEHCIVLNGLHTPMVINRKTLEKMFDFLGLFPHYFVGSNADLPIVGGSLLGHDHFQGGNYKFPMEKAEVRCKYVIPGYEGVSIYTLNWPLSTIRLVSEDGDKLVELGEKVINHWKNYEDKSVQIIPFTENEPHNTVTPIARINNHVLELDIALRNNRRNDEYPVGIFHPHEEVHHIKKENIGLIEVMGLAVLPPRLLKETLAMEKFLLDVDMEREENTILEKHLDFCNELKQRKRDINRSNVKGIIKEAIGERFVTALKAAGVFKDDKPGHEGFDRFIKSMGWEQVNEDR